MPTVTSDELDELLDTLNSITSNQKELVSSDVEQLIDSIINSKRCTEVFVMLGATSTKPELMLTLFGLGWRMAEQYYQGKELEKCLEPSTLPK